MVSISLQTIIIIVLVAFIIGIIVGTSLARPRENRGESKSRRIWTEVSEEEFQELTKRKPLIDTKEMPDFTNLKLPSDINFDELFRDEKKKLKGK